MRPTLRVWCLSPLALLAPLAAQQPAGAPQLGYDGGYFIRSADGRDEVVLEGLFQVGLQVYQRNRGRTSQFELRRMRPELSGKIADRIRFKLEPKFTEDEVELEEAWVGVDLAGGRARLMLGRMKAPFNLEEVRSRRHIDFPRFSILNQLAPAEDHGVFLNGTNAAESFEYGLAFYNGTGAADTGSSKDVALRAAFRPLYGGAGAWRNLHLGAAATWGDQDTAVGGDSLVNAFDADVIDFAAGARLDGDRLRLGAELAWFDGPVMLQSEAVWMRQDMSLGGAADDIELYGAYVSASFVLTGEERRGFAGVRPQRPVDFDALGAGGAWVLALRASQLTADDALQRLGFAVPGRYTEHIRSVSVGLNWILNDHAILRHAWVHSFYSDDVQVGGGLKDQEGALMVEWQVHF